MNNWIQTGLGEAGGAMQTNWADIPPSAARHPLIVKGRVNPVVIQPLFKEIDELHYGGKHFSS